MNYISIINFFWDSATINPLPTEQIALYMALLHVCNRNGWAEWFQAPNQVLSVLTGLSVSRIEKAREGLEQRNLIEFNKQCNKPDLYRLITAGDLQDVGSLCEGGGDIELYGRNTSFRTMA